MVGMSSLAAELEKARSINAQLKARLDRAAMRDPVTLAAHLSPSYQVRAHVVEIGKAMRKLSTGEARFLAITCPPQAGKSTTAAEWGAFWWMATHPQDRVAVASYGLSLAVQRGIAVRRMITDFGARYGMELDRASKAKHDFKTATGGGMLCVGVGGGFTGRPADFLIVDDPHKDRKEADSHAKRQAVHDFWSGTAVPRLQPGAPVMIIQTRWHDDDLLGRRIREEGLVEEGGRWHLVHLPAIAEPANLEEGIPPDALGREPGEPLPHPRIAEGDIAALHQHWEDKKSSVTARDWGALYQGNPKPAEGALLSWEMLRSRRTFFGPAAPMMSAVAIDPSGGGRDTAGIIGGYLGEDKRLYYTHDASGVMSSDEWSRAACRLAYATEAHVIVIEVNFGADMATRAVRTAWDALIREGEIPVGTFPPRIKAVRSKTGKLLRAEPIAQQWIEDWIRTANTLVDMESEWATWQPTNPDSPGRIDASVHLAYALLPVPGASTHVSSAKDTDVRDVKGTGWAAATVKPKAPPKDSRGLNIE